MSSASTTTEAQPRTYTRTFRQLSRAFFSARGTEWVADVSYKALDSAYFPMMVYRGALAQLRKKAAKDGDTHLNRIVMEHRDEDSLERGHVRIHAWFAPIGETHAPK